MKTDQVNVQKDQDDSVSALDLWHQTLVSIKGNIRIELLNRFKLHNFHWNVLLLGNEHEKAHDAKIENLLSTDFSLLLNQTLSLWQQLYQEDKRLHKRNHFGPMTKRMKTRARKTLLRGFASNSSISSMQTSYKVSNLFSFERRCTGGRISSDSETMEVEGLQRNRNRYVTAFQSR